MSGGIAYVYDEDGDFPRSCNKEMVQLCTLEDDEDDGRGAATLIRSIAEYTGSERPRQMLRRLGRAAGPSS